VKEDIREPVAVPEDAKLHEIPPPKKRAKKGLTASQREQLGSIREGDKRTDGQKARDAERKPDGPRGNYNERSEAMRRSRAALGLSGASPILKIDKLCPPFEPPLSSSGQGGERIHVPSDLDAILARKYLSRSSPPGTPEHTRPRRKSEGGWASAEREWLGWELFSHLTKDSRKPWFWSHWSDHIGLGKKAFIGPFSRSAVEASSMLLSPAESIGGLCELLRDFAKIEVSDSAEGGSHRLLESVGGSLPPGISSPPLHIEGRSIEIHRGRIVSRGEDGSESWVEEGHSEYLMQHIPASFAVAQCLFDSRDRRPARALTALLRREVNSCTSIDWPEAHAMWVESLAEIGHKKPFPKEF